MIVQSAIAIIDSLPQFISEEEHKTRTSSTPNSFADIPPVLRHQQVSVSAKFEPPIQELSVDDLKNGTLYVVESVLIYMAPSGSKGFTVPYPNVTLHAISRTDTGTSIYCQIDSNSEGNTIANESEDDDGNIVDMVELTLTPSDSSSVEAIFEALSVCASLHPDPNLDEGEDDDAFIDASNGDFEVFDGSEEQELSEVGRAALAHLESVIQYPNGHQANDAGHAERNEESDGTNNTDT